MIFNEEDKITYTELAPSLQQKIDNGITTSTQRSKWDAKAEISDITSAINNSNIAMNTVIEEAKNEAIQSANSNTTTAIQASNIAMNTVIEEAKNEAIDTAVQTVMTTLVASVKNLTGMVTAGSSMEIDLPNTTDMNNVLARAYVLDNEVGSYSNGKYINAEGVSTIVIDSTGFKVLLYNDDTSSHSFRLVVNI